MATTTKPRRSATQPPPENSIVLGLKKAQTDNIFKPKWVDGHCLYPQSVKAYNLPWNVLQKWLVKNFPQHKEYHETQREQQDYYFFYIELEKLTEEHHNEINALREKTPKLVNYQLDRGRHSPDPVQ